MADALRLSALPEAVWGSPILGFSGERSIIFSKKDALLNLPRDRVPRSALFLGQFPSHRLDEIGAADQADDAAIVDHRGTFDPFVLEQAGDVMGRGTPDDGDDLVGHDGRDLAAFGLQHFKEAWREGFAVGEVVEPPLLALAEFAVPAQQVAFGEHAHRLAVGVDHRQAAQVLLRHEADGDEQRGFGMNGGDILGHEVFGEDQGMVKHRVRDPSRGITVRS